MSTAPHHDRTHGNDERARIENAAAQLRVPVAANRYWRIQRRSWRAEWGRSSGSGSMRS